jgi:hypothetical protein
MRTRKKYKIEVITANPQLTCKQLGIKLNCTPSSIWKIADDLNLKVAADKTRIGGRQRIEDKPGYFDVNAYGKLGTY